MRIKDCRYRVVCSRSEELLRFTNLTTVLRPSPTHPTNRRFRSSSFPSLVFFLLGSISFFLSFFLFLHFRKNRIAFHFHDHFSPNPFRSMCKVDYFFIPIRR